MWKPDGLPAFRPTRSKVSHSGLSKRENYRAGRCSKSGILKFISLLATRWLREGHSCLRCFSSTAILSRDQWKNRLKNKNVANAQIRAQDISRGIEMVKLKTNGPIAKEKKKSLSRLTANPPLWLERSAANTHAGAARWQHAAGRDRIARSAAGVSGSIEPPRHCRAAGPLSAFRN